MGVLTLTVTAWLACLDLVWSIRTGDAFDMELLSSGKPRGDGLPGDLVLLGWHGSQNAGMLMAKADGYAQPTVPLDSSLAETPERKAEFDKMVGQYQRGLNYNGGSFRRDIGELGNGFYIAMDPVFRQRTLFGLSNGSKTDWKGLNDGPQNRVVMPAGAKENALGSANYFAQCANTPVDCLFEVWVSKTYFEAMVGRTVYYPAFDSAWEKRAPWIDKGEKYKELMDVDYVIAFHDLPDMSCVQIKFNAFGYNDPYKHLYLTKFFWTRTSKL